MKILLLGPDGRNQAIQRYLIGRGHEVKITANEITSEYVTSESYDYLLSNGYAPIIKESIISLTPGKILNLHATYLPWGKGIGALLFGILENAPIGVSIHIIDKGVDTGDVFFRKEIAYSEDSNPKALYSLLLATMDQFFFECWPLLESGEAKAVPQRELGKGSPYRTRFQAEMILDLLPERWDTTIRKLREWGGELQLSEEFWERVTLNAKAPDV